MGELRLMFLEKLNEIQNKYNELTRLLSDPEIFSDYSKSREYSKEQSDLAGIVDKYNEYKKILSGIKEADEILASVEDEGLKELAALELEDLMSKKPAIG
jgi:peptide chain release factor 1